MRPVNPVAVIISSLLGCGRAANIFVSHYQGTITNLNFNAASDGSYSLTTNSTVTTGGQPSWLSWDSGNRTLYAPDETSWGSATAFAVSAAPNGGLTLLAKAKQTLGAVASVVYGNGGYIALAHYGTSAVTTYKLPLTSSSSVQQTFTFTMSGKGAIPSRQDAPHPHQTIQDPTGRYILVPDLGADLIRIYSIGTAGTITSCTNYVEVPGTGPRHGAFSVNGKVFYVANELANTVHAFNVAYTNSCIALTKFQSLTTLPGNKTAPSGTKVGEVHVKDNFVYLANRRDLSFSPNDSIASFSADSNGTLTFIDIISSGGTYPRTFDISKDGEFVVIGDQTTANVVVVKRDPTTGKLGPQLVSMRIGSTGHAENDDGLSAVLWDQ